MDDFHERFVTRYASGLREGHRFSLDSQEHCDKMLTWAIGLMGAGVLGSYEVLSAVSPGWRAVVLSPWVFGILSALGGRLVGRVVSEKDNLFFFEKVMRMESVVLHQEGEARAKEINAIMSDAGSLGERKSAIKHLNRWFTRLYYTAHILLGIGVLSVLAASLASTVR